MPLQKITSEKLSELLLTEDIVKNCDIEEDIVNTRYGQMYILYVCPVNPCFKGSVYIQRMDKRDSNEYVILDCSTSEAYFGFKELRYRDKKIQDIFPDMPVEQREYIMTGIELQELQGGDQL